MVDIDVTTEAPAKTALALFADEIIGFIEDRLGDFQTRALQEFPDEELLSIRARLDEVIAKRQGV